MGDCNRHDGPWSRRKVTCGKKLMSAPISVIIPTIFFLIFPKQLYLLNKYGCTFDTILNIACGSCYGAKAGCCNTCAEVKSAYDAKGWAYGPFTQCGKSNIYSSFTQTSYYK